MLSQRGQQRFHVMKHSICARSTAEGFFHQHFAVQATSNNDLRAYGPALGLKNVYILHDVRSYSARDCCRRQSGKPCKQMSCSLANRHIITRQPCLELYEQHERQQQTEVVAAAAATVAAAANSHRRRTRRRCSRRRHRHRASPQVSKRRERANSSS